MPDSNVKAVSRTHFEELSKYLAVYLSKGQSVVVDAWHLDSFILSLTEFSFRRATKAHSLNLPAIP
jgi:hypothetical protein